MSKSDQYTDIINIAQKITDARGSLLDAQSYLREADNINEALPAPGTAQISRALSNARGWLRDEVDDAMIDAGKVASKLVKLAHSGALDKLLEQCQNCTRRLPDGCCQLYDAPSADISSLRYPCGNYDSIPDGCNCYRCRLLDRDHDNYCPHAGHVAVPGAHCCGNYSPAVQPKMDPAQGLLPL